jgi:DNA polymerase-3 subunit epsilon
MFTIIDIETTGGSPVRDRITEIAVLVHDGNRIVREFTTLINPECNIPYHISALTGISNEMVADAPKFFEIARELVEITKDRTFVAHNVSFDYSFIRAEFRRLGYEFKRDNMCTVRLSRKIIPGHRSYSLGTLCQELNIPINGRHRALGDAYATAQLFEMLLETDSKNNSNYFAIMAERPVSLNPFLDPSTFKGLPESPGVYYFYNPEKELIYIGKSKNVRTRILSHFSDNTTAKALQMRNQVAEISYELTGNELIALLKESEEIKRYKPLFNRAQRRSLFQYGLFTYTDHNGYIRFYLEKTTACANAPLTCFTSKSEARGFLARSVEKFGLCQKLCGLYPSESHCFHFEIGSCRGACIGREQPEAYNLRANRLKDKYHFEYPNLLIIDTGRNHNERSVIKIENGKYIGFGYFDITYADADPSVIQECINPYMDNLEIRHIIRHYLRNNNVEKILVMA